MKAPELRKVIADLERQLEATKKELAVTEARCNHQWGDIKYVPEHIPGYTIQGDPPGVGGVDHRGPCHVPSKTIRRWERICTECKLKQTTERTEKKKVQASIPGLPPGSGIEAEAEVPVFPTPPNTKSRY